MVSYNLSMGIWFLISAFLTKGRTNLQNGMFVYGERLAYIIMKSTLISPSVTIHLALNLFQRGCAQSFDINIDILRGWGVKY